MTSQALSAFAGVLLSLAFSYVPGLNTWYEAQDKTTKRLVMLAAIVAVSVGALLLSCADVMPYVTCDKSGVWLLVECIAAALVANQSAYPITKPD